MHSTFLFLFLLSVNQLYLSYPMLSCHPLSAAPTVAFGGLTNIITDGHIGVIEFIISCGAGGMFYSLFSGQPMTFVGPTGGWVTACLLGVCVFVCSCLSISVACHALISDVRTRLRQWRNSRQGMNMPTKSGLLLSNYLLRHMFKKNSYSVLTRNSITRSYFTPLSIHQLIRSSVRPEYLILFLFHLSLLLISSFLSLSISICFYSSSGLTLAFTAALYKFTESAGNHLPTLLYSTLLNIMLLYSANFWTCCVGLYCIMPSTVAVVLCSVLQHCMSMSFVNINLHHVSPVHKI